MLAKVESVITKDRKENSVIEAAENLCLEKREPQDARKKRVGAGTIIGASILLLLVLLICFSGTFVGGCSFGPAGKAASVKGNMNTLQIATESYADAHHGRYPVTAMQLGSALLNQTGNNSSLDRWPINPFTGAPEISPVLRLKSVDEVQMMRHKLPFHTYYQPGQILYYCDESNPATYAIVGINDHGYTIAGTGGTLVLSNR